jgi:penicillin-insensitive murein endopeptidase
VRKRLRTLARVGAVLLVAAATLVRFGNDLARLVENDRPSVRHEGWLENGKRLPTSGPNFVAYSWLGAALGRNAVHDRVRDTLLDAFADLAESHPDVLFVYGETGWPSGGAFWPHRTHREGLSVDVMVPVRSGGRPSRRPTWPWNRWGYDVEFDASGVSGDLVIDFEAVSAHLMALHRAADANGLRIERVIFDAELLPELRAAKGRLPPVKLQGEAWVRHDEHYHVDFVPDRATGG